MGTKICTKCGRELDLKNFGVSCDRPRNQCNECRNSQTRKWRAEHKADIADYNAKYRNEHKNEIVEKSKEYRETHKNEVRDYNLTYKACHKEESSTYMKLWREENKEHIAEYQESRKEVEKKRYENNKEEILKKSKLYYQSHKEHHRKKAAEWLEKNRETYLKGKRAYGKKYYKENKKLIAERGKKWKRENRDNCNIAQHRRRSKVKSLPHTLTDKEWRKIKDKFDNRCAYCGEQKELTIDHFIPVKNYGELTHNNVIPACKSCNCSKQDKDFFEWYPEQECYDINRERKILKHLNYKNNNQQLTLLLLERTEEKTMRAKIISHTDKGKENKGVQESVGGEGEVFFPFGRLLIPVEASGFTLTTSKIQKITVETKNSIYELEIVEDIEEDKENE